MSQRLFNCICILLVSWAGPAWAGDDTPPHHTFGGQFIFWAGAMAIVLLMGRIVFREQLNERRTLRRIINEVAPFYPEFDLDRLKTWVGLCGPHIWQSWNTGEMPDLDEYTTAEYRSELQGTLDRYRDQGYTYEGRLLKVLKVHTIGLYMVGDGPAPKDVELMLRIESKAEDCLRDAGGKIISGKSGPRQVQHFWALRHDGQRLRLHGLWVADGDMTDLAQRPVPPSVTQWRRPESSAGNPGS